MKVWREAMDHKRCILAVIVLAALLIAPISSIGAGFSAAETEESYVFNPFYEQLGSNQKAAYDAMVSFTPEKLKTKVHLVNPIYTEVVGGDQKSALDYLTIEAFSLIYVANEAIYMEKPLAICTWGKSKVEFNLDQLIVSGSLLGIKEFTITVLIDPAYADDPATEGRNELREKVDALNKAISDYSVGSSNIRTMVGNINGYLTGRLTYDPNWDDDSKADPYIHDAYGALVSDKKYAVCDGYSKGFQALCQKYNIKCYTISGYTAPVGKDGHAWNAVLMDNNEWYPVDVTWNDTGNNAYLLSSADSFNKDHIPGKHPYGEGVNFNYPMFAKEKYDKDPWYTSDMTMYLFAGLIGAAVLLAIGLTAVQNKKGGNRKI